MDICQSLIFLYNITLKKAIGKISKTVENHQLTKYPLIYNLSSEVITCCPPSISYVYTQTYNVQYFPQLL